MIAKIRTFGLLVRQTKLVVRLGGHLRLSVHDGAELAGLLIRAHCSVRKAERHGRGVIRMSLALLAKRDGREALPRLEGAPDLPVERLLERRRRARRLCARILPRIPEADLAADPEEFGGDLRIDGDAVRGRGGLGERRLLGARHPVVKLPREVLLGIGRVEVVYAVESLRSNSSIATGERRVVNDVGDRDGSDCAVEEDGPEHVDLRAAASDHPDEDAGAEPGGIRRLAAGVLADV